MIGSCFSSLEKIEALTDRYRLGVPIRVRKGTRGNAWDGVQSWWDGTQCACNIAIFFYVWYLSLPSHSPSVKVDFTCSQTAQEGRLHLLSEVGTAIFVICMH